MKKTKWCSRCDEVAARPGDHLCSGCREIAIESSTRDRLAALDRFMLSREVPAPSRIMDRLVVA